MSGNKTIDLYKGPIDPNRGYLCIWMHWRPNPDDPDPQFPGQKLSMVTFIPAKPGDRCLCGSGKQFRECCRARAYWHPLCPSPDGKSFSLMAPQSVTFKIADRAIIRERLMNDVRLQCTADDADSAFWVYWGDPALDDQHGTLCFGDIELKRNRVLHVTALSDIRMRTLLALLRDVLGDEFKPPKIRHESVAVIDKKTGNRIQVRATAVRRPGEASQ